MLASGAISELDALIAALAGSAKSGMWDFRAAYGDSGTLTADDLSSNGSPMLQAIEANQPAITAAGLLVADTGEERVSQSYVGAGPTDLTVLVLMKTTKASGSIVGAYGTAAFSGLWTDGSTGTITDSMGTPTVELDDIAYTTRQGLGAVISNDNWHVFELLNADASGMALLSIAGTSLYGDTYKGGGTYKAMVSIDNTAVSDPAVALEAAKAWLAKIVASSTFDSTAVTFDAANKTWDEN